MEKLSVYEENGAKTTVVFVNWLKGLAADYGDNLSWITLILKTQRNWLIKSNQTGEALV